MKKQRVLKNVRMLKVWGVSYWWFKRRIRRCPDKGMSRIPARKLKSLWNEIKITYKPLK